MAGRDRIDILLRARDSTVVAAVEVKMLSGLGRRQLERYEQHLRDAQHLIVVHPRALAVDVHLHSRWRAVTWEDLLDTLSTSPVDWVATSAAAARTHLSCVMPTVYADTPWGPLPTGGIFDLELRARASWVFSNLRIPPPADHRLTEAGVGGSWVNSIYTGTGVPDHWAIADAEERLPSRDYPKTNLVAAEGPRLIGPSVLVGLTQQDITTSEGFDWDYLLDAWQLMAKFRDDWVTRSAIPRSPHDRAGWERMVARGAPKYLGIGYGQGQVRLSCACLFGARFQLPPTTTLREVVATLHDVADLLDDIGNLRPVRHH